MWGLRIEIRSLLGERRKVNLKEVGGLKSEVRTWRVVLWGKFGFGTGGMRNEAGKMKKEIGGRRKGEFEGFTYLGMGLGCGAETRRFLVKLMPFEDQGFTLS